MAQYDVRSNQASRTACLLKGQKWRNYAVIVGVASGLMLGPNMTHSLSAPAFYQGLPEDLRTAMPYIGGAVAAAGVVMLLSCMGSKSGRGSCSDTNKAVYAMSAVLGTGLAVTSYNWNAEMSTPLARADRATRLAGENLERARSEARAATSPDDARVRQARFDEAQLSFDRAQAEAQRVRLPYGPEAVGAHSYNGRTGTYDEMRSLACQGRQGGRTVTIFNISRGSTMPVTLQCQP